MIKSIPVEIIPTHPSSSQKLSAECNYYPGKCGRFQASPAPVYRRSNPKPASRVHSELSPRTGHARRTLFYPRKEAKEVTGAALHNSGLRVSGRWIGYRVGRRSSSYMTYNDTTTFPNRLDSQLLRVGGPSLKLLLKFLIGKRRL